MNKLIYKGKTYEGKSLLSTDIYMGDSLAAETLSVDTLTSDVRDYQLQVRCMAAENMLVAANGMLLAGQVSKTGLKTYRYGEEVEFRRGDDLVGRYYLQNIKRTGNYTYRISAVSSIGLLLTDTYYGGIYSGITVAELVSDIINGTIRYTLDASLASQPVYGWLKKSSRRDALKEVLFAMGGQIRKDKNGDIVIAPQSSSDPYEIPADDLYQGGDVAGLSPASAVKLTEHIFIALPGNEEVTLFDGEAAAEPIITPAGRRVMGVLVGFSEPFHDLKADNVTILESGANYAVLGQSSSAVLTGKKYAHTERVLTASANTGASPNVVTSNSCTIVNLLNAENVLNRLAAYYGAGKSTSADIVLTIQRPGDAVSLSDPFGEKTDGYISELDLSVSNRIKARATIISGYIPTASGNYYEHVAVLTEDTEFVMPPECKGKARVVVISGGDGGGLGSPGEEGGKASPDKYGTAGEGGEPGTPGNGGKIYVETIQASPGQRFAVKIGKGGKGATVDTEAEAGGETTFGTLSSANGRSSPEGYVNLFDGSIYGDIGIDGIPGGRGSGAGESGTEVVPGDDVKYKGETYHPGEQGDKKVSGDTYALGGLGGGPAAGAPGGDGERGALSNNPGGTIFADGGPGGKGAVPVKADNGLRRGQGGGAGHGGGGGGGGGPAKSEDGENYQWPGDGGSGGDGGEGGNGAPGIVLVYY